MFVSAVIPTYNRNEDLVRAVRAVLNQSHDEIEVVVVDDHSTVPAREILTSSNVDIESVTIYRHQENRGANAARNTGIDIASGEYIAFLDDDDTWCATKIEKQLQVVTETNAGVVYTGVEQISGETTLATKTPDITGSVTKPLLLRNFIGTFSSVLVSQKATKEVGGLDERFPSWQDWDFYLRLSEVTTFESVPQALVRQTSHEGDQISDDYRVKCETTAPLFLNKHRQLAQKYDVLEEFEATVEAELGWSAVGSCEFDNARSHFFRSLRYHWSPERFILLLLTIGGYPTYALGRHIKQSIPGGFKFKK